MAVCSHITDSLQLIAVATVLFAALTVLFAAGTKYAACFQHTEWLPGSYSQLEDRQHPV